MVQLIEVSENQKFEFNRFVATAESGSFLQSWDWGEWQEALGRQVFRFWVSDGNNQAAASIQLIKMPLPFGRHYLYCPYGPVIAQNFQFPISNFQSIFNELIFKFPDCVFIRIEPKNHQIIQSSNHSIIKSFNIQPTKTLIVDLSKTEEALLAEMHPKTRYNIRLARKHKVRVEKDLAITPRHGLYFKEAVEQLVETQKRQGFKGHAEGYYKNMIDFFGFKKESDVKISIYKALFQNQLLSSAVMIDFGHARTYLFGGSSQEHKQVMAPYALHWQAILDAMAAGLLQYDFWGVETSRGEIPGFARFKLGFKGRLKEYTGTYDIINKRFFYGIYRVFRYIHRLL